MKRVRVLIASAIVSVAFGALAASSASAALPVYMKSAGKVVPKGTGVIFFYTVGVIGAFCEQEQEGKVKSNGKPKDQSSFTSTIKSFGCEGGASSGGSFKQVELTDKGKVIVAGKLTIKVSSTCSYEVKKLESEISFPSTVDFFGEGVGKLGKGSNKACPKTERILIEGGLDDMEIEELLEVET